MKDPDENLYEGWPLCCLYAGIVESCWKNLRDRLLINELLILGIDCDISVTAQPISLIHTFIESH